MLMSCHLNGYVRPVKWQNIILYLILATVLLLNGCSTVSTRDGPPPFDVDVSKIPDAVPKVEPLAKYGNMPFYRVKGKRYYVLKSSKHFEQQGTASWYGTKFHAQRTSSGERYNMLAMTAAHKTLPLPTYVQVTNLRNGKQIIVKVNDRGPFSSDRIIDLSYVAAKKLGMIGRGTALVNLKAIDPRDYNENNYWLAAKKNLQNSNRYILANNNRYRQSTKHSKTHHANSNVYLQVGTFKSKTQAEKVKKRLLALTSSPVRVNHIKRTYHVEIGPIGNVALMQLNQHLKSMGLNSKTIIPQPT